MDNEHTECTSAEETEAVQLQRPNTAEASASGLVAAVDDNDDLPRDVIERHDDGDDTAQRVM